MAKGKKKGKRKVDKRTEPTFLDHASQCKMVYRALSGEKLADLAREYGVAQSNVYHCRKRFVGLKDEPEYDQRVKAFMAEMEQGGSSVGKPPNITSDSGRLRRRYDSGTKEHAVNKCVNQGVSIADVASEYGVTEANIYAWRYQLVGTTNDELYATRCQALAYKLLGEAAEEDVLGLQPVTALQPSRMNGAERVAPTHSPQMTAPTFSISDLESMKPVALSEHLIEIEQEIAGLEKDAALVRQQLEIRRLRKELARGAPP